jgi:hypothetical protein
MARQISARETGELFNTFELSNASAKASSINLHASGVLVHHPAAIFSDLSAPSWVILTFAFLNRMKTQILNLFVLEF